MHSIVQLLHHLRYFGLKKFINDDSVVFHSMFHENWDKKFIKEYFNAIRYSRQVKIDELKRVYIFSYSRSGTHNFYSRFHYIKPCFAFAENLLVNRMNDPYQLTVRKNHFCAAHYLMGSVFLKQGLQRKKGSDLTHIFLLNNFFLKFDKQIDVSLLDKKKDYLIFYMRNFIRVLYSQHKSGIKYNKPHFVMTEENFQRSVLNHKKKMKEMFNIIERQDIHVKFISHEVFCATPGKTIDDVCDFINIPNNLRDGWDRPEKFFEKCFRTKEKPVIRDGKIWCPSEKVPILGKGGEYNPLPAIDLSRTLSDPIKNWITKERLDFLRAHFSESLIDFWLNDNGFNYGSATSNEIFDIVKKGV